MHPGTQRWALMPPDELQAAIADMPLALVPCGALEWHGPHLAAGCDILRGEALCDAIAQRLGGGVVLPPLYTAVSALGDEPGTLCFSPALVRQVAAELYAELERCGFRYVLMLLAHGGPSQEAAFDESAEAHMAASDLTIIVAESPQVPLETMGPEHAGADETLELLAANPSAVLLDRCELGSSAARVTEEAAERHFAAVCDGFAQQLRIAMGLEPWYRPAPGENARPH